MRFSANLGFLWSEKPLPTAIRAAKAAGFDAVECHWPYDVPADDVAAALNETGLAMLGLNTSRGNVEAGESGLSALPGRQQDARVGIDEAIHYGSQIGARSVHVMAGFAKGEAAHQTFVSNLSYACTVAAAKGMTVLIEPLNTYDAPGYFLSNTAQAKEIITQVSEPNIKLMFDCYHVQVSEGNLTHRLHELLPIIGHIQFASVPNRAAPDTGEIAFGHVFRVIEDLGWDQPLGAEYKPHGPTEDTLGWLKSMR